MASLDLTNNQLLSIHNAMHSSNKKIELNGFTYNVLTSKYNSEVRYVFVEDWKFLTQNPHKKSFYGFKAKAGSEITWIVYPDRKRSWGLIENGIIVK